MVGGTLLIVISLMGLAHSQNCADQNGNTVPCPLVCQHQNNGTFFTSARQCSNTLPDSDCDALFPCTGTCNPSTGMTAVDTSNPNNNPSVRAFACTSPTLRSFALQCARSCSMCCETTSYNCDDDTRSPVNCQLNTNKCRDSSWVNIMSQYCPRTCGLCSNGTCTDAISGCNTMTSLCRHVDWVDYMRANCARTCDTCTSSTPAIACSDVASNCGVNSNLCNNSVYYSLMTQQCARTCNRCGVTQTSVVSTCTDSDSNCSNWARNGFCSNSFYSTAQKRQYCARTCSLC